jgi:hypothetical protein
MRPRTQTTQTSLDLRGEGLRAIWKQLPERCRTEAIAIWTQLIARAAQSASRTKSKGVQR